MEEADMAAAATEDNISNFHVCVGDVSLRCRAFRDLAMELPLNFVMICSIAWLNYGMTMAFEPLSTRNGFYVN